MDPRLEGIVEKCRQAIAFRGLLMAQGIAYGGLKVIDQKPVNPQIFLTDPHWLPGLCGKVVAEGTQLSGAVHPVKAPRIRVGEKPCRKAMIP